MYLLDEKKIKQRDKDALSLAAQEHLEEFLGKIRDEGVHPTVAASGWDSNYKKLGGTTNQYEIRLNGKERATFTIIGFEVKMLQVGGHT